MTARTIWHAPQPGHDHWSWRCLRCDQPVARHVGLFRRVLRRLTGGPR